MIAVKQPWEVVLERYPNAFSYKCPLLKKWRVVTNLPNRFRFAGEGVTETKAWEDLARYIL